MPLLIDGHNLIGKLGDLSLSDPNDERKLVARVRAYAEKTGKRIAIVFDPAPYERHAQLIPSKSQHGANLSVVFADAGVKADAIIRERVGTTKDKQGLIVVTSDHTAAGRQRVAREIETLLRERNMPIDSAETMSERRDQIIP